MINKLKELVLKFSKKKEPELKQEEREEDSYFSTHISEMNLDKRMAIAHMMENMQSQIDKVNSLQKKSMATDSAISVNDSAIGGTFSKLTNNYGFINEALFAWYASQGFIGYQACAILSQNWLINKCCLMPAQDAFRNGFEITVNDGTEVNPEVLEAIKKADKDYRLKENLEELVYFGRVFGIRIAMFIIDSDDPDFYKNPFNIDGVTPGSYKGISQIDPYWITPILDDKSSSDPSSINFYEPTWWQINGRMIHRTHLIIYRPNEVPDILKPNYLYGGIPYPQRVYERVYAAERTANEAPILCMTKRTDVLKTDTTKAVVNQKKFYEKYKQFVEFRDNLGIKVIDTQEDMQRLDTSLSDLDAAIMTQFQLVCAECEAPSTKVLGTSPKGFGASGEYEEASYHESLETIEEKGGTPMADRHHLIVIKSDIAPMFGIQPFEVSICWNELDAMTAEEKAIVNKTKSETALNLVQAGAIDGQDERNRIISDKESGYNGLIDDKAPEIEPMEENENENEEDNG